MKAHKLVKEYEQKLQRDPGNVVTRLKLAATLRELGQVGEALRQYRAVAETYHREGRLLQALAVCRSALEIDPNDFETRTMYQVIDAARTGAPEEESTQIAGEPASTAPDGPPGPWRGAPEPPRAGAPQWGGPDGLRPSGGARGPAAPQSTDDWDVPTRPGAHRVVRVDEHDIVGELPSQAERLVRAVLGQPTFRSIPEERRPDVIARFTPLRLPGSAALLRQGEPGGGLYVVMTGALRIRRKAGGRDMDVGQLDAGSFFADLSLVRGEPAAATVVAVGATELVYLAPRDFYDLCASFPAVWEDLRRRAQSQSFLVAERL
ncbi:MAG TPA: cyclic nucleotide-binding domain-containing protein [Haliangiales bacterium]|nr:cyclic nucleotide-binding domain-containing protein [Haliangiales bacterium]